MRFAHWAIAALLLAIVPAVVAGCGASGGYATITPKQLQTDMNSGQQLLIVDLREPNLYKAGHIPGAINIPFDEFNNRYTELPKESNVVLVCHTGPMGDVSGSLLVEKGYTKVSNLQGGMATWNGNLQR